MATSRTKSETASKATKRTTSAKSGSSSKKKSGRSSSSGKAGKKKDIAESYNKFKVFHGQQYTGMAVGRTHNWKYDQGDWKEKKLTPDKWEISFNSVKRRKGHAPEGSGVPVGTQYHWYILAHQYATKLNANDYDTAMKGLKFKIAHKRFDKEKWNISEATQRKHLIALLKDFIKDLEKGEPAPAESKAAPAKTKTDKPAAPAKKKKTPAKK